jgi:hypothetical protein
MTAPVVLKQEFNNEKISMTAPVIQSENKDVWSMTFMMSSKYKMDDLPKPKNSRVQFRIVEIVRSSVRV